MIFSGDQIQGVFDSGLFLADDFGHEILSAYGGESFKTPTLDALAKEGALFRRAYTTVPSCIPARFSLLTGLFPQTSGVVGFRAKPIGVPTMPAVLAKAGYQTTLVGRNATGLGQISPGQSRQLMEGTFSRRQHYRGVRR